MFIQMMRPISKDVPLQHVQRFVELQVVETPAIGVNVEINVISCVGECEVRFEQTLRDSLMSVVGEMGFDIGMSFREDLLYLDQRDWITMFGKEQFDPVRIVSKGFAGRRKVCGFGECDGDQLRW